MKMFNYSLYKLLMSYGIACVTLICDINYILRKIYKLLFQTHVLSSFFL